MGHKFCLDETFIDLLKISIVIFFSSTQKSRVCLFLFPSGNSLVLFFPIALDYLYKINRNTM